MPETTERPCAACEMFDDLRAEAEHGSSKYDQVRWTRALLRHRRDDHGEQVGELPRWPSSRPQGFPDQESARRHLRPAGS